MNCLKKNAMRKLKFTSLLLLLLSVSIFSCNNDDENRCISITNEFVSAVNAPSTGIVDETISIEVDFRVFNGCGQFNRFIENINGNSRTIEVEAIYDGCTCTTDAPTRSVNYDFVASTAGDYELNFRSNTNEFITVTITII